MVLRQNYQLTGWITVNDTLGWDAVIVVPGSV